MDSTIAISAGAGALVAWVICHYIFAAARRRYLRETTAQMQSSMGIQDRLHGATAMCYLNALQAVESGDLESAKRELAFGAANFYHQFSGLVELSSWIVRPKRDIELHAKKSEVLRAALDHKPDAYNAGS